jgi:hypothetical protein
MLRAIYFAFMPDSAAAQSYSFIRDFDHPSGDRDRSAESTVNLYSQNSSAQHPEALSMTISIMN